MRRLIRADFRRIIKKINIWVFLIIGLIVPIVTLIFSRYNGTLNNNLFLTNICGTGPYAVMVGVALLLAIYGDEFRSKAMITVIGRGFSRLGIVMSKFIDTVVFSVFVFVLYALIAFALSFAFGIHLTPIETKALICTCILGAYYMIGNITFAALALYVADNVTVAVFIYVVLSSLVPMLTDLLGNSPLVNAAQIHFERYTFVGFGKMGFSDLILGLPLQGIMEMVLGAVLFVGTVLVIISVFFYKKELDF